MPLSDIRKVTDVALFVADASRAVDFYHGLLGLGIKRRDTGFAEFFLDDIVLAVWEVDDVNRALGQKSRPRQGPHAMLAVRLESPEQVDALYAELSSKGVPFVAPPADYPWNARGAYFTDPDGNLWELYCWLGAPRTL